MPDFDHNNFFRRRATEEYYPDQMSERPSTKIKVRIRPNQTEIPNELSTELRSGHNMDLSRSRSDNDVFIVSGIPPVNGFGEREVMEVVRKYAPYAQVVPQSSQRGGQGG